MTIDYRMHSKITGTHKGIEIQDWIWQVISVGEFSTVVLIFILIGFVVNYVMYIYIYIFHRLLTGLQDRICNPYYIYTFIDKKRFLLSCVFFHLLIYKSNCIVWNLKISKTYCVTVEEKKFTIYDWCLINIFFFYCFNLIFVIYLKQRKLSFFAGYLYSKFDNLDAYLLIKLTHITKVHDMSLFQVLTINSNTSCILHKFNNYIYIVLRLTYENLNFLFFFCCLCFNKR